jgi:hypothetical protein
MFSDLVVDSVSTAGSTYFFLYSAIFFVCFLFVLIFVLFVLLVFFLRIFLFFFILLILPHSETTFPLENYVSCWKNKITEKLSFFDFYFFEKLLFFDSLKPYMNGSLCDVVKLYLHVYHICSLI